MKQPLLFIIILFLAQNNLLAQSYVQIEDTNLTFLDATHIKPNEKKGAYYNEHWSYHVILDNDAELHLTFSISHFAGFRGSATGARLSILNWEGNDYHMAREYGHDDLVYNEQEYKLALHPNRSIWFEGDPNKDHRFFLRTEKDGVYYDMSIHFNDPYKGFTMGDGVFKLGSDDEVGIFSHIPFSKVSGFISLNQDTVNISGIGFMDHIYQTNVGTRLFETSYKFNERTENGFSGGYFMVPKGHNNEVAGYAYTYDGKSLTLKYPENIKVLEERSVMGKTIPSNIQVTYSDNSIDAFLFNNVQEKISMLDELSGLKKMFAKRFLGGEILFYRGKAQRNNSEAEVSFHISLVD
ncbi:MAG: hypothetical protein WD361_00520 [Gracilimonas sp.]